MSGLDFRLDSSTRVIAGSQEAVHLLEQKQRVENAVMFKDPALTLDTSKAFLETTIKTVLKDRIETPALEKDMNALYKSLREEMALNCDQSARNMLDKLTAAVVNWTAQLRNKFGAASHGDDGYFDNPIEMPEAEMVARMVDSVSGFLLLKNKISKDPDMAQRIHYSDYPDFNDYLDLQHDDYTLPFDGVEPIPCSQFLFTYDEEGYREMLLQYLSSKKEEATSEEEPRNVSMISDEPIQEFQDFVDWDDSNISSTLVESLFISEGLRKSYTFKELAIVTQDVTSFLINRMGVDWFRKDSEMARLRVFARRQLSKIGFDKNYINSAAESIVKKISEITKEAEQQRLINDLGNGIGC